MWLLRLLCLAGVPWPRAALLELLLLGVLACVSIGLLCVCWAMGRRRLLLRLL